MKHPSLSKAENLGITGVACPKCNSTESQCLERRPSGATAKRRRECQQCGTRFTTYELTSEVLDSFKHRHADSLRTTLSKLDAVRRHISDLIY